MIYLKVSCLLRLLYLLSFFLVESELAGRLPHWEKASLSYIEDHTLWSLHMK